VSDSESRASVGTQGGRRPAVGGAALGDPGTYVGNTGLALAGDAFTTIDLIDAMARYIPPPRWLGDTVFPVDNISGKDLTQLDYYNSDESMPGHIHPLKRGIGRPRRPYFSSAYSPPVAKLTRDLPASDLAKRRIGRTPYENNVGADPLIMVEDIEELTGELRNLDELLASQVLLSGEIIVTDFDDGVELDRIDHQSNGAPVYPERKLSIRWDPSSAACLGSAPLSWQAWIVSETAL
jgi:hypothetical protein